MKERIYLIGQISFNSKETYEWRKRVQTFFGELDRFEIFNPCTNEFNLALNNKKTNLKEVYEEDGIDVIVPKDKSFVLNSSIAIANLNHYDKEKDIIGTLFELAWYHDHPEKTVIGVFDYDMYDDKLYSNPFIRSAVDVWVKNEKEACEMIIKYFGN